MWITEVKSGESIWKYDFYSNLKKQRATWGFCGSEHKIAWNDYKAFVMGEWQIIYL